MQTVFETAMGIRGEIESELGIRIPDALATEVFEHCKRKCECAKKSMNYLPTMFRTELHMQLMVPVINFIGEINFYEKEMKKDVRHLPMHTMPSRLS